jgi:hypothetical protein
MEDNKSPQSVQEYESQPQQPEDIIRQDYNIRVAGGQTFVIPNTLRDLNLPLAYMHKPNYSDAVDMPGGVSGGFLNVVGRKLMKFTCLAPTRPPTPI